MNSVNKINNLSKSDFISIFGNVFEKTNWIAEKAYNLKPFLDSNDIKKKFISIYNNCNNKQHLEIFNSHPQLAIEKIMTIHSKKEQISSKLNSCTKEELNEFIKLNNDYKKKFNFTFIVAVAGLDKKQILDIFKNRIKNNFENEFNEAIIQVKKIATIRINQILQKFYENI